MILAYRKAVEGICAGRLVNILHEFSIAVLPGSRRATARGQHAEPVEIPTQAPATRACWICRSWGDTGNGGPVSRQEDVHVTTLGILGLDNPAPMRRDTIFRLASLSKPVTAVAAMMLLEECRLRLDDPIDSWLPELANRRVLKSITSGLDETVPALRPITLRDLLTFRMGIGAVMAPPNSAPIQRAIRKLKIGGDGPRRPGQMLPADEWLRRLGRLPLMAQPGERWLYQLASDVLGVLDRARLRSALRRLPRRTHFRAARYEGHGVPCSERQARSFSDVVCVQPPDPVA